METMDAGINANELWKVQEALANVYLKLGEKTPAQYYANLALTSAPGSAKGRLQDIITQTLTLP
jgi:hypothetical protein